MQSSSGIVGLGSRPIVALVEGFESCEGVGVYWRRGCWMLTGNRDFLMKDGGSTRVRLKKTDEIILSWQQPCLYILSQSYQNHISHAKVDRQKGL